MNTITYTYRGGVERGTGAPGYRWHNGYSETIDDRPLAPWMTKAECRIEAKARGARAIFAVPAGRIPKAPEDRRLDYRKD